MTDLKFTKEDAQEAFFNLGRLGGRLEVDGHKDEAKRLYLLLQVVSSYATQLDEENRVLRGLKN